MATRMVPVTSGRRPGRPRKAPDRVNLPAKVPERQKEVYRAAAASHGLGMADYVALVMARAHNLPVPEYIKPEEVSERFEQPLLAYEEEVRQTA